MEKDNRRNPGPVADLIRKAESVAICAHVNPDGDAIGSALAMCHALCAAGKKVRVFCQDKVPDNLMMLPGAQSVLMPEQETQNHYDLLLCVDISEVSRMGRCIELKDRCASWAQIDHHMTNPGFADAYDIDGYAPANCVLIREMLKELGLPLSREISMCLYAGLSTDTGNFAFASTNAETFAVMSELMECGLPLQDMNRTLFRERSKAQLLLMGKAITNMKFMCDGQLAVMTLTAKDFEDCGALPEHADTIVNLGLDTMGTRMALLCRENGEGKIKASLRAVPPYRVDEVAVRFGGGGHEQAAGISIAGTLAEVTTRIADAMAASLNG